MNEPLATLEGYDSATGRVLHLPIHGLPTRIGRRPELELPLYDPRISHMHAELFADGDSIYLRDLASTNGTFVNGHRLQDPTRLHSGDIIRFATLEFRFRLQGALAEQDLDQTALITADSVEKMLFSNRLFLDLFESQSVVPYFQPIVRLGEHDLVGYEMLGRGDRSDLPHSPRDLFNMAATYGMEADLSELFRTVGVRAASRVLGDRLIFVNMHPKEVGGTQLVRSLQELRSECPTTHLVLELHESAMTDTARLQELREQLNDLSIGLAYDDFGAGQARLNELAEVPPDFVKFDVSLIRHLHQAPPAKKDLVRKLVQFTKDLGVQTLAEGVELSEERDHCEEIGFDLAQGFQFGKPEPIEETRRASGN